MFPAALGQPRLEAGIREVLKPTWWSQSFVELLKNRSQGGSSLIAEQVKDLELSLQWPG